MEEAEKLIPVLCYICEEEFYIDILEAMECVEDITNNQMVCPVCADTIIKYLISRN